MPVGYAQVVLGDTPASYWRLGDLTAGSSAADSAGSVAGTYSGQFSRGMPGAVMGDQDSCVYFLNGKVDVGNVYAFTGTSAFTAEAWFQVQAFPTAPYNATIIGYAYTDGGGLEGWGVQVTPTGQIGFWRYLNGVSDSVLTAASRILLGTWAHVVATYDGATMTLYLNGASVGTAASSRAIATATQSLQIANDHNTGKFTGMVDEAAVYTHALSAASVLAHYNAASFLTNAPTFSAATSGAVAASGQVNQFLGAHSVSVHNTGTLQVGSQGSAASPGTTWTLSGQWLDQPFTMPSTVDTVDRVEIALQALGTGADITASIQADVSGKPSGTALASCTIPAQFIPVNRARMVSLPLQVYGLTMSGVYHLVLQSGGTSGNTLVAPQGGSGLGTMQTSPDGVTWTAHAGVSLIAGIYQGDASPTRNVRESATAWAELENDAGGRLVGVYEYVQGARTSHRLQYSGNGRLAKIV